jgi:hypothetical protein
MDEKVIRGPFVSSHTIGRKGGKEKRTRRKGRGDCKREERGKRKKKGMREKVLNLIAAFKNSIRLEKGPPFTQRCLSHRDAFHTKIEIMVVCLFLNVHNRRG